MIPKQGTWPNVSLITYNHLHRVFQEILNSGVQLSYISHRLSCFPKHKAWYSSSVSCYLECAVSTRLVSLPYSLMSFLYITCQRKMMHNYRFVR